MLTRPPGEREWVSWFYVALWSLIIFLTIPYARAIQIYVSNNWDRQWFGYLVMMIAAISVAAAIIYLFRNPPPTRGGYVWLLLVFALVTRYTLNLMKVSPEEALHFVQYGLLGVLVYRALSHRVGDASIYWSAAIIGGIIGIVDEGIQWATPRRYWSLGDIWLNLFGSCLGVIAISKGLRPSIIDKSYAPAGIRRVCILLSVALLLLGGSFLNTPARIAWYAGRIPSLEFLIMNESVMFEYGHRYEDPEIGVFRSRLSADDLARSDLERAEEAAMILDQFHEDSTYASFLEQYTPVNDPFLHEARVHLFRRDRYIARAPVFIDEEEQYLDHLNIAYCEHLIVEGYFPNTLRASSYILPAETIALMRDNLIPDYEYDSGVSRHLVTRVSERQVFAGLVVVLLVLGAVIRYYGRKRSDDVP